MGQRGIVLGLVGSVCAGKSQVARRLRELGATVYDADAVVRQLYEQPEVKEEVRRLFGADVFGPNGAVNRSAIAERIFGPRGDLALRERLTEEVIFPRSGKLLSTQLDTFRRTARTDDVLVLDAPTLFEARRADCCDRILWVTAPTYRRHDWASARGWPDGELERREAALMPPEIKRNRADYVIDNAGSLTDLHAAVDRIWERLRDELEKNSPSE